MSSQLLPLSADLQRLVDEGYEVAFRSNMLLVGVAYVNRRSEIERGFIASSLETTGEETASPVNEHTVRFLGATADPEDQPCDSGGQPLTHLMNEPNGPIAIGKDLVASCGFSQKLPNDQKYADYYEKMTTYANIFLAEVHAIDPTVQLKNFMPVASDDEHSVHRYFDSATSLAKIGAVSDKLRGHKVAIVGVGGTGSYILDAVAKTAVAEIHLYDADELKSHNAFRAPGAVPLEAFRARPTKVDFHQATYDQLHSHVVAHPVAIDEQNVDELTGFQFVFVSIDAGPAKKLIVDTLHRSGVPFVDTGMGIDQTGSSLGGIIRSTRVIPGGVDQAWLDENFSYASAEDDVYHQNIQIAELNMLNAAFAVLAWKKSIGFYRDYRNEVETDYTIDTNLLVSIGLNDD